MENQKVIMLFVPRSLIKQALVDVQYHWSGGFSWVRSCDYLKDDGKFAVQVVMTNHYPYLEDQWKKWEKE